MFRSTRISLLSFFLICFFFLVFFSIYSSPRPSTALTCSARRQVFFAILIGAANIGQATPHVESLSAARGAAATIYSVIGESSQGHQKSWVAIVGHR